MELDQEIRQGKIVIGHVRTLNIARQGESEKLRFIGMQGATPGGAATGQAHETKSAAIQDVIDWAAGKPVAYLQQAVVPLPAHVKEQVGIARLADAAAAGATYLQSPQKPTV
jgi:hypothetical protein